MKPPLPFHFQVFGLYDSLTWSKPSPTDTWDSILPRNNFGSAFASGSSVSVVDSSSLPSSFPLSLSLLLPVPSPLRHFRPLDPSPPRSALHRDLRLPPSPLAVANRHVCVTALGRCNVGGSGRFQHRRIFRAAVQRGGANRNQRKHSRPLTSPKLSSHSSTQNSIPYNLLQFIRAVGSFLEFTNNGEDVVSLAKAEGDEASIK
ncbi:unnamed protein product [Microthlaspi erraticum]|uniref:Uncharacterized protein n=1 Tax=Microthlaspi erraticum TaxID=1685480 RepID=A0A6D2KXU7_9BRAS|nr:unnamed protein product [Microthlaspi erraticum]